MSDGIDRIALAEAEAAAARARLDETLTLLQQRLAPRRLARDTAREASVAGGLLVNRASDSARRHPGMVGGVAAAIGLVAIRRPVAALWRRLRGRDANHE